MRLVIAVAMFAFFLGKGKARADTIAIAMTPEDASNTVNTLAGGTDPEWTSQPNIDLTGNLLLLIEELGGNPADIAALYQPGAALADSAPASSPTVSDAVGNVVTSDMSSVPEPATIVLPVAAAVLLLLYAVRRARKIRRQNVPLQRAH